MIEDIFDEIKRMRKDIDSMFNNFFQSSEFKKIKEVSSMRTPPSDVKDTKDSVVINLDMPGVDKKDIQVSVIENRLEVKAQKKRESKIESKGYFKQERSFSGFYRALTLPSDVDAENAKVDYKDGVLKITIPKKEKIKEKKKIKIKVK